MRRHLLLTGATGLLGRYLVRDLQARGVPVAALVRPHKALSGAARLDRALAHWEAAAGGRVPRPVCLDGDVTAPGLGLSAAAAGWAAAHCGRVLHAAASLTFRGPDPAGEPWRTNAGGTRAVLDFCRRAGVREYHHVSTAYVCGRTRLAREDDPPAAGHRNDYERSKAAAEGAVRAADFLDRPTVYRPAVVVGDAVTGYTATYHGLYPYLRFVAVLGRHAAPGPDGRWPLPVRLTLTGEEGRNLVPVDWVSACVSDLVADPRLHGRTYHLAPARPTPAREVHAAAAEAFGFTGTRFVGPDGLAAEALNETERRFYEAVATYQPYWAGEPTFDQAHTRAALPGRPCPPVDRAVLLRLIAFAVRDRWGKGPA